MKLIKFPSGTEIQVVTLPDKKRPYLMVYYPDENCGYKVASFNSKETADWFCKGIEDEIINTQVLILKNKPIGFGRGEDDKR